MTLDEIIRMAKECGVHEYGPLTRNWSFELSQLERFAALVAANEREACAKMCDDYGTPDYVSDLSAAIRERNEK